MELLRVAEKIGQAREGEILTYTRIEFVSYVT